MALHVTANTARLALATCLSAILASCSTTQGPAATASDPEPRTTASYDTEPPVAQDAGTTQNVSSVSIDQGAVQPDAPSQYEVVRGDTLWDISARFLKEPWRWPEIWNFNPQIENPDLIYPGDELALQYINGRATLSLTRNTTGSGSGTLGLQANTSGAGTGTVDTGYVRLVPRVRTVSLDNAIPTIPSDDIAPFLLHPRAVDQATLNNAAYVVANSEDRLISSIGSKIYVRGPVSRDQLEYGVFRKTDAIKDPVTGAHLGFELTHVADAKLLNIGDPSTLGITSNKMETINGDILLPLDPDDKVEMSFTPRVPELEGEARIASLVNAIAQAGRNQIVVLNVGKESNIEPGDVLAVESRGKDIVDEQARTGNRKMKLPDQRTGVLMVFRTYDKVSYALVMESTRPLRINDVVTGI